MAPALTEPLSPTEKSSKSAASSVPVTRTTRRSRAAAAAAEAAIVDKAATPSPPTLKTTSNTVGNKERKSRRNSTSSAAVSVTAKPTTLEALTTRVTRSKDNANQRLSEQAAIPAECNNSQATTSTSSNSSSNSKNNNSIRIQKEPMGLSAALDTSNNNNNNNPHTSTSVTSSKKDKGNSDSEEKILADIATNIEEALSAEICLRNQLCDVNISSEEAPKKNNSGTELNSKDTIFTSRGVGREKEKEREKKKEEKEEQLQNHMDPVLQTIENNILNEDIVEKGSDDHENEKVNNIKNNKSVDTNTESATIIDSSENSSKTSATNADLDELTKILENEEKLLQQQADNEEIVEAIASPNLFSTNNVETTTSHTATPTATGDDDVDGGEELDTIEARLSQLDGNAIISATESTSTTIDSSIKMIPNTMQDELKDLQAQLGLSDENNETTRTTINETILERMDLEHQSQQHHHHQDNIVIEGDKAQKEQHFNMESTNINMEIVDAGDGTTELVDQEELVEEVLKVLKGFDPATANADTLNDLNALFAFSDVYQNINSYDDVNSTAAAAGASSSSILSTTNAEAETEITQLDDTADTVNTSGDSDGQAVGDDETPVQCNVNWLEDEQKEIVKAQQMIQRKMDFLIRKLRKSQARYMCKHASEEIAGVIEYAVRAANNKLHGADTPDNSHLMSVISARPPPEVWQEERENPIPSAEVYALLRKLEISAKAQQLCKTTKTAAAGTTIAEVATRKSRKSASSMDINTATAATIPAAATSTTITPIDANSSTITTTTTKDLDSVIPTFDMLAVKEILQVTGMLQTEMREVQLAIDSDATESSSGCESADELITYNNQIQQPLEIGKRAAWRYARDRAAIAARWSWLLSQISDLDIKIRQHTDLYNDIVRKKGPVIYDNSPNAKMGTTYVKQRQIQQLQQYRYEQQIMPLQHQQHQCEQLQPHQLQQLYDNDVIEDDESGACRTRGYLAKTFRKRKILTTTNLHTISKKAARPTTIKCGCQWPMQPCTLCTGRTDPTAPRELPNTMTKAERVALLDSGYHPVLSFPEDISHAVHFEAIARLSEWQQRVMRCQVKSIVKSVWKAERAGAKKYDNGNSVKRRYIKKKDRLAAEAAAEKDAKSKIIPLNDGLTAGEDSLNTTTCTTTPLVANKRNKMHYPMSLGERMTTTTAAVASSSATTELTMKMSQQHPIGKAYPAQKYDNYNTMSPSIMISRRNNIKNNNSNNNNNINHRYNNHNRNRKAFSSSSSSSSFSNSHFNNINNNHYSQSQQQQIPVQYNNSNGNSSSSETTNNILHIHENWDYMTSMRSRTASPTHANSSIIHKHERSDKKRNSYDIDNIVIPYSVAAATRVEIIPYKEIPTPKWRVITKNNLDEDDDPNDDMAGYETDEEDVKGTKDISCVEASKSEEKKEEQEGVFVKKKVEIENKSLSDAEEEESKRIEEIQETKEHLENSKNEHQEKDENNVVEKEKAIEKVENIANEVHEKGDIEIAAKEEPKENVKNIDNAKSEEKEKDPTSDDQDDPPSKKRKFQECEEETKEADKTESPLLKVEQNEKVITENLQNGEIPEVSKVLEEKGESISNVKNECTENKDEKTALNDLQNDKDDEKKEQKDKVTTRSYDYHETAEEGDEIEEENDENQVNENISDEIMAKRHERALTEERRKFQTYLKFPWTTRSRANRRGDSRAESSGANTPDPASPAPATTTTSATITTATKNVGVKDQENNNNIPASATASQTNTSANTTTTTQFASVESNSISTTVTFNDQFAQFTNKDNNNGHNYRSGVRKRRRTTSSKREQERRSLTPDSREILPPYEPLKFPLSDEAFDNMINLMPMDKFSEINMNSSSTKFEICNNSAVMTSKCRKSVLGGFGRGRSGLRRQSTHTSNLPTRSKSLRTRLSNRPYVLNNNKSSSLQHNNEDQGDLLAFEDTKNINSKDEIKNMLHVNGKNLLNATTDDMFEETEDETETCEFGDEMEAADTDCDDDDDDDDEEEEEGMLLEDDDDDDGFLKHPLATTDYDLHDQLSTTVVTDQSITSFSREQEEDSSFAANAGQSDIFSDRDMDSSEAEPFQEDDDPNDPEWGNNVRMRKKI